MRLHLIFYSLINSNKSEISQSKYKHNLFIISNPTLDRFPRIISDRIDWLMPVALCTAVAVISFYHYNIISFIYVILINFMK